MALGAGAKGVQVPRPSMAFGAGSKGVEVPRPKPLKK